MLWLGLAILGIIASIPILYVSLRQGDYYPLIAGVVLAIVDFVWETANILVDKWGYVESQLFIGVIPIELVLIFFSTGVIAVWLFRSVRTIGNDLNPMSTNENFLLLIAIAFAFLHIFGTGVYRLGLTALMATLGVYGLMVSERKGWVLTIGLFALLIDFILETLLVTGGSYWYDGGYTIEVASLYMFGAWFVGGIITNLWVDFDWDTYSKMEHKIWDIHSKPGYKIVLVDPLELKTPAGAKAGIDRIFEAKRLMRTHHKFTPVTVNNRMEVIDGLAVFNAFISMWDRIDDYIPVYVKDHQKHLSNQSPLR